MQSTPLMSGLVRVLLLGTALFASSVAFAVGPESGAKHPPRNFDARVTYDSGLALKASPAQLKKLDALRTEIPELSAVIDERSGVTRSLYNRTGYLTAPGRGNDAEAIALDYVRANLDLLGLRPADLEDFEITDLVYTKATGATRIYLRQRVQGLPVFNGQLQINVNRDGRIISVNNAFVADLRLKIGKAHPGLDADRAVRSAFQHLGLDIGKVGVVSRDVGPAKTTRLAHEGLSKRPIDAQLMWLPVSGNEVRLVWNFQVETLTGYHYYDLNVDAGSGQVWTRFDWVSPDQYRVYPLPVESPNHTTPLPPADGRILVVNPADATASPNGWHDTGTTSYTITRGNNVHAFEDSDGNQSSGTETDCGPTLDCDFSMDLNQAPSTYSDASTANVFYWANIIHDVQYQYGFDEAGGNFQANNFGNGGSGNDYVLAQAQSGFTSPSASCPNNAFFSTPPDGSNGSMIMCLWTSPNPDKDGDFDHGIIAHESGHGISTRQVGGPSNSSCLGNNQQGGEGWGDYMTLWYLAQVGDQGTDGRGVGTYALNQPTTGAGIRTQRYSTDPAINNHTYESIQGMAIPHGVGEVWAQALWEVYWALVDQHGFDADHYNVAAGAGNHRAMLYVNEGLKNTACEPAFTDARDGIIQAAADNFGGEDVCRVWEAFAAFGLGTDAVSGGSNSTNPTNGFAIPAECQCSPEAVADAGPDQAISLGSSVQIGTAALAGHSYSWSPGGSTSAQPTVSPLTTTTYTVTATTSCGSAQDSVQVTVFNGNGPQDASFDAGLGVPACDVAGSECDSLALLDGRNSLGPEPNQPNTLDSCTDGGSGSYHSDESNDRIVVSTLDGTDFTEGETVEVAATVWAWSSGSDDTLDLYYAADANSPSWQLIGSFGAPGGGQQTITAQYTLPSGSLQAVRANFRYQGTASSCSGGNYDDADDLVFPVVPAGGNTAPTVNITGPSNGSTFSQGTSVGFSGTATDSEDGTISGSLSWTSSLDGAIGSGASFATSTLSLGTHTITASVTDSGGLSDSDSISVTIDPVPNNAPVVTITSPANGSNFDEGTSVAFSGTATDAEDGNLAGSLSWSSSLDGAIGSGGSFSTSGLSVGTHTITASVTDSGGAPGSDSISVTIDPVGGGGVCNGTNCIDWDVTTTVSFATQDSAANFQVQDGGDTMYLQDNTWRRTEVTFNVTANTVVEFDFTSTAQGEIHGIGFDEDNTLSSNRIFKVHGSQNYGITDFDNYAGGTTTYSIPVGQYFTGSAMYLVLVNDNDAGSGNDSTFSNVRVYESGGGACSVDEDFEGGAAGWTTSGTCSTGTFVLGTPTEVVNGGVTTQLAGDHTTGSGNALFTATNSSAGVNDVDGGTCTVTSPTYTVSTASNLSVWWFHGQRDSTGDSADGYLLEYSTNGGSTWTTLQQFGDATVNAAWTEATATGVSGSVVIRVSATDGTTSGDLVEAGLDDLSICD